MTSSWLEHRRDRGQGLMIGEDVDDGAIRLF